MHDNGNGRGTLNLKDAAALAPPVNPVEAMRRQLALALFGGVREQDVLDVAQKLKEMALAGDHKAMQMFFKLMLPDGKALASPPAQDSAGLRMMADALRDLVDEIRVSKATEKKQPKRITAEDEED